MSAEFDEIVRHLQALPEDEQNRVVALLTSFWRFADDRDVM